MRTPLTRRQRHLRLALLLGLALLAFAAALLAGSVPIAAQELIGWWRGDTTLASQILALRLERATMAFVSGGALALAGCLMQVLLRNPLAEPYILGLSGGASVGAMLALLACASSVWVDGAAFAGSLLAMGLVAVLARRDLANPQRLPRLLLTGVVLAAGWGAIVTLLLSLAPDGELRSMVFWLMGDLAGASFRPGLLLVLAAVLGWSLLQARRLNVLMLGTVAAQMLGIAIAPLRRRLLVAATLLAALAVTTAGSIGFVGLIVPHATRLALGHDHRLLLPAATLAGGSFLLLADTLARCVLAPLQLPVGVITALIGVPVFLLQLAHDRH